MLWGFVLGSAARGQAGLAGNKRLSPNPPSLSTDCPVLCLIVKDEETRVQYIRSSSELPFQQPCGILVSFSPICLQNLLYFGFAVKGKKSCRIARWTWLQPWILER